MTISIFKKLFLYCILVIWATTTIFPVGWAFLMSIKEPEDAFTYPPTLFSKTGPTFDNYIAVLFPEYAHTRPDIKSPPIQVYIWKNIRNSVLVAFCTTMITLFCSILGAYAFSRFSFKAKTSFGMGLLVTRMLPPVALIIPLYLFAISTGLFDTVIILILSYSALLIPLNIWILKDFFDLAPKELEEAAAIDGCSRIKALALIVIPLVRPGLAAVAVLTFLASWNEFALALTLTGEKAATLPLITMQYVAEQGTFWGPISATCMLILGPGLVFVLLAQKHIIKGLTLGAIKG